MQILVAGKDIEIDTCNISFHLVIGLKALPAIAADRTCSELAISVGRHPCAAIVLAKRVISATIVDITIRGHHLHQVTLHLATSEPALRHEVFAVVAVTLAAI